MKARLAAVPLLLLFSLTASAQQNDVAVFVGGATIYLGGALRDAKVDITTLFNCGAVGLVVCAALLWCVREPALKRISAA